MTYEVWNGHMHVATYDTLLGAVTLGRRLAKGPADILTIYERSNDGLEFYCIVRKD